MFIRGGLMLEIISDLNIEELTQGYTVNHATKSFHCIFCGEEFEEGVIYSSKNRSVNAERGIIEHIYDEHGGVFYNLLTLDKDVNGLSPVQKNLLKCMYKGKSNKEISEELDIKTSTVRTHKFKIQQMKRESKILLALLNYLENKDVMDQDSYFARNEIDMDFIPLEQNIYGNVLHPFFSKYNLK